MSKRKIWRDRLSLDLFEREAGKIEKKRGPLSDEELKELSVRSRKGDVGARNEIVERSLQLALEFTRKQGYGLDGALRSDDIVQENLFGLIKAAETFDSERGASFKTHAIWQMRGKSSNALSDNFDTVRLPNSRRNQRRKMRKISDQLSLEFNREPSHEEIAGAMGISEGSVRETLLSDAITRSIDTQVGSDNEIFLRDLICSPEDSSPDFPTESEGNLRELFSKLRRFKETLKNLKVSDRNKLVFRIKYGIENGSFVEISSEKVAKSLDPPVSRQEVDRVIPIVWAHLKTNGVDRIWGENFLKFMGSEDLQEVIDRNRERRN